RDTQVSVERVAGLAATQIEHLGEANRNHQEVWRHIQQSMEQYQDVFGKVEADASGLLAQIGQHLENYVSASRHGFEELVKISNEHFVNATSRLAGSVNELDEVLETLSVNLAARRDGRAGDAR